MNQQENEANPLIEPTANEEPNYKSVNKRQEKHDEEDIYDKHEISHYVERSKLRKDSIFLTKQKIDNELKEKIHGPTDEKTKKVKSVGIKKAKNKKDDPSLMLDARLVRAEQRSSRSDSKMNRDVIAFEDELQSTIANLFEIYNEPVLPAVDGIVKD